MTERISRRRFLAGSGRSTMIGGALLASAASRRARAARGPNEMISLGWIGCGRRGEQLLNAFQAFPDVRVAALCDVNRPRAEALRDKARGTPGVHTDFRELLDRKDVDAVIVASNTHWHCLHVIHACRAGKDVYAEKPLSWCIREGRLMIEAARKHDRLVMLGTQQRSMAHFCEAAEFIQSGQLGRISEVESWNVQNIAPQGFGSPADQDPPAGLDWDFWLGPAPKAAYNPNRYNNFYWFWDYGGGYVTEWGVHLHDFAHWAMQADAPLSATAVGGRFSCKDNTELPDTIEITFEYPGFVSRYYHRRGNGRHLWKERRVGSAFYGEKGTLLIDRLGWEVIPEPVDWYVAPEERKFRTKPQHHGGSPEDGPHQRKFLDAVRDRKQPAGCDIETGHRSSIPGTLGNIACRIGRKIHWNAETESIKNDPEAGRFLSRDYRKPWRLEL